MLFVNMIVHADRSTMYHILPIIMIIIVTTCIRQFSHFCACMHAPIEAIHVPQL